MFKDFCIKELFDVINNPQLDKGNFVFNESAEYPYFTRTEHNNGIFGYVEYLDEEHKISGNSLAVGMISMKFHYMQHDFYAGQFTKTLIPRFQDFDEKIALYFMAILNKHSAYYQSYLVRHFKDKVSETVVSLPVIESNEYGHKYTTDDIDWPFIRNCIAELEQDCIAELDDYLKASGLDDYELTAEDKEVLSLPAGSTSYEADALETDSHNGQVEFKKFKIASSYIMRGKCEKVDELGLFDIFPTKKKINANEISFGGTHPYVARGSNNNGIRGYIDFDEKYLNPANTISFGQDTATMYYQPESYFTGDKIQVFELNKRYGVLSENVALYLIELMSKAFADFSWGQQSFAVNVIANIEINLPITKSGNINFGYMERYIQGIEKLAIADVVKYKNQVIATTKQVIARQ